MAERIHHHLARHVDEGRLRSAIDAAERATSGKIEVILASHKRGDMHRAARDAFALNLHNLPERNGVLFFVVPSARELVVWGDAAIHDKVGQKFWDETAALVSEHARDGDLTAALAHGIERVGRELARHFPKDTADKQT